MHVNSRYPISHRFLLDGKRRACRELHIQAHVAIAAPRQGEIATPIYSLNHARSGSDRVTASTAPLCVRPRRSRVFPIVLWLSNDFHEVSRAVSPKWQGRKFLLSCCRDQGVDSIAKVPKFAVHSISAMSSCFCTHRGTSLFVTHTAMENDPDEAAKPMGNGPDRLIVSQARYQSAIEDLENVSFRLGCGVGSLIQNAPHVAVTLRGAVTLGYFCTFFLARACSNP